MWHYVGKKTRNGWLRIIIISHSHLKTNLNEFFFLLIVGCVFFRDDVKKYTNTNKTISKKAQEKMKPAKKKENK